MLVVDADASTRSVLEVALHRDGFQVDSVTSGREALLALGEGRVLPALVVLSSELQGEDGYSLCAQLRGDRRTAKLPVLLLASHTDEERLTLAEVVGADEFIPKPVFARDVAALARLRLGLDGVPLPQMLRALLSAQKSGQISIAQGRGRIIYRRGVVIDAQLDAEQGFDALMRALMLVGGPYQVSTGGAEVRARFELTLRELVTMVFPRLLKWEQLASRSVPLDERLEVNFAQLAKALPALPDAVNQVVRLFDGLRTVRQVLLDSTLNETITLEVANRLHLMAVVTPVEAKVDDQPQLKDAPRLFEPRATEAEEDMKQLFGDPDGIITPVETPVVRLRPGQDWYQPARGSGLEMSDPTEGWAVRAGPMSELVPPPLPRASGPVFVHADTVELVTEPLARPVISAPYSAPSLPKLDQAVERQLQAFNVRPEVEAPEAPRPDALRQFSDGQQGTEESAFEQALAQAPIPLVQVVEAAPALTVRAAESALEDQFFAEVEAPLRTVADAVLGPAPSIAGLDEDALSSPEGADQTGGRVVAVAAFAALLIGAAALVAWQQSKAGEPRSEPVAVAELPVNQPAPVVHLATADEIPPAPPAAPLSERMQEAVRLYETGKLAEAAVALEQVVSEESSNTLAWLTLGLARYDLGDNQGAQEAVTTALALDAKMPRAHLLQATLLLDQGKRPLANQELQTYLELEPNGPFADEAKALLKR